MPIINRAGQNIQLIVTIFLVLKYADEVSHIGHKLNITEVRNITQVKCIILIFIFSSNYVNKIQENSQ